MKRNIIILLISLLAVSVNAQDVYLSDGVYRTSQINQIHSGNIPERVVIKSVEGLSGKLDIRASQSGEVRIQYTKLARVDSRSIAIDYIDLISVNLEMRPENVSIELRAPNPAPWTSENGKGMVEAEIFIPEGSIIEVQAVEFELTANGPFREFLVPSSFESIYISNVNRRLDVTTVNSKIKLNNISGTISATTSNSTITAKHITAIENHARFRNEGGKIIVDDFEGNLNVRNRFGQVTITDFKLTDGSSVIRGTSAPISIEIVRMNESQLLVTSKHEDIEIFVPESISAFFSLSVDNNGQIKADGFPFTTDLIEEDKLNLISGDGLADINGTIRGEGNIYIKGIARE